jgi:hypothetical protein
MVYLRRTDGSIITPCGVNGQARLTIDAGPGNQLVIDVQIGNALSTGTPFSSSGAFVGNEAAVIAALVGNMTDGSSWTTPKLTLATLLGLDYQNGTWNVGNSAVNGDDGSVATLAQMAQRTAAQPWVYTVEVLNDCNFQASTNGDNTCGLRQIGRAFVASYSLWHRSSCSEEDMAFQFPMNGVKNLIEQSQGGVFNVGGVPGTWTGIDLGASPPTQYWWDLLPDNFVYGAPGSSGVLRNNNFLAGDYLMYCGAQISCEQSDTIFSNLNFVNAVDSFLVNWTALSQLQTQAFGGNPTITFSNCSANVNGVITPLPGSSSGPLGTTTQTSTPLSYTFSGPGIISSRLEWLWQGIPQHNEATIEWNYIY